MKYTYDGTFEGFLSVVFDLFKERRYEVSIEREKKNTLFQGRYVETSMIKAERVYIKMCKLMGRGETNKVFSAFLSEAAGVEECLFNYIKRVIRVGGAIERVYIDEVERVERYSQRALRESHKFKGFVRFRRLRDGSYYAIIKPDCNILPLVGDHFMDRFSDQDFVIHDVKRKKAIVYSKDQKRGYIADIEGAREELLNYSEETDLLHEGEGEYIGLWRGYFEAVSIDERRNLKCQRGFMPKKYWENLIEVNGKE